MAKRETKLGIEFDELNSALQSLGLSSNTLKIIYRRISAILHLGNVTFVENSMGNANISESSRKSFEIAAHLMDVDLKDLEMALLDKKMAVGPEKCNIT